jgi:phospholipase C
MRLSRRFPRSAALAAALLVTTTGAALPGAHPDTAHAAMALRGQDARHQQRLQDTIDALRGKVKYVFVLYQENRSFDSYFATFPSANGIYARPASQTPGYYQPITNTDGTTSTIQPFRIGPSYYAADTDDVDHSHTIIDAKMNVVGGTPQMDRFAQGEEVAKGARGTTVTLAQKQYGELAMAYADCDTVPLLWSYAKNFTLMDNIYQQMTGPSTPGNLAIIGAQAGQTQQILHPDQAFTDNGNGARGVPVLNDICPLWGSRTDPYSNTTGAPYNSIRECHNSGPSPTGGANPTVNSFQQNLTYASLPVSFEGPNAIATFSNNNDLGGGSDLADLSSITGTSSLSDTGAVAATNKQVVPWGWYEEGYNANDPVPVPGQGNVSYASYIVHHNGPQYFGYVMNNAIERAHLHGLNDLFDAVSNQTLPASGVFYAKGGYYNFKGYKPVDPDPAVQKNFTGDDDHPAYSDAQISEAVVGQEIDAIARSKYWSQSAIIVTYDDSEGNYDHVQPPIQNNGPASGGFIADGPRVPFIVISPYSKQGIVHSAGDHGSVVKFIDTLFGLTPLANLPNEYGARQAASQPNYGPDDALTPGIADLVDAFDPAKLDGSVAPLPATLAEIPAGFDLFPTQEGQGCAAVGITPVQPLTGESNAAPVDFNPRPSTNPGLFTPPSGGGNGTPELGSGELIATSLVPVALLLLYQRRRRTRRASRRMNNAGA